MLDEDEWSSPLCLPATAAMSSRGRHRGVVRALEPVARGDAVFGPAVAGPALSYLKRPLAARDPVLCPELSDRDRVDASVDPPAQGT